MQKRGIRRIGVVGVLALVLAVAIPGTALAGGTFRANAGFLPQSNVSITIPAPPANIGSKQSKGGTLRVALPLDNPTPVLPSTGILNIHAPKELEFETKGLAQCNPADISGQSEAGAQAVCSDALIGQGTATNASAATGAKLPPGKVLLYNGTKQNGSPTVLFDSLSPIPGTVIVAELQKNSPIPGFGSVFVARVAVSSGGPVPDGVPIVNTDFTNSRKFTDKKLKKKSKKLKKKSKKLKKKSKKANGKKAKKLKKKSKKLKKKSKKKKKQSKKSWVTGECTDGDLVTRVDWELVGGGTQTDTTRQACT